MSPGLRNGNISRALKYIIDGASNCRSEYKEFMPKTKRKRWMLIGYAFAMLILLSIASINNEIRQNILDPLVVVLIIMVTGKIFKQLKINDSGQPGHQDKK